MIFSSGVKYGNGVYFARDASYSMGYAKRQLPGSRPKMYMAKFLLVTTQRGQRNKAPPLKNDPIILVCVMILCGSSQQSINVHYIPG